MEDLRAVRRQSDFASFTQQSVNHKPKRSRVDSKEAIDKEDSNLTHYYLGIDSNEQGYIQK